MEQYLAIKKNHQKEVLFFRLGDFYEMFYEDAVEVSKLLNLTLTHRASAPMCGVPFHAAKVYIARLLRLGKRVAICEQGPVVKGKGLTERKVVEIITPGNAVDDIFLDQNSNNFMAALCFVKSANKNKAELSFAFSYIDISTGEFYATSWKPDNLKDELIKELGRVVPKELIISQNLRDNADISAVLNQFPKIAVDFEQDWYFSKDTCYKKLLAQFGTTNLRSFSLTEDSPEVIPAGFLLDYLSKTHHTANPDSPFPQVVSLKSCSDSEFVLIDESSRRNLEIVNNLRDGTIQYSLLETLQYTVTAMGSRLLRNRLFYPLRDVEKIQHRQNRIKEFFENPSLLKQVRMDLSNILDIERLTSRVALERAHGKDMQALRSSLESFVKVRKSIEELNLLEGEDLTNVYKIVTDIQNALVDDPPTVLNEGGLIKEGWSEQLDHFKSIKNNFNEILADYLEEEKSKTGIQNLKIKFTGNLGYYIEVSKGKLSAVPSHFVLKRTFVNYDRYTTARLDELERELIAADENIVETERQLFCELRKSLFPYISYLLNIASEIAELDVTTALANAALVHNWVCPTVDNSKILDIQSGRHPVVEYHLADGCFVPNSSHLEAQNFALVTGPNMAGKSTYLRQNALIVLLAQIGSFVPAESAHIGIVDRIFCRVGAADNLARGESTFLVEMTETAIILRNATEKSLVIMDEVGRGTSTEDGLSIAWAVSEFLLNEIRCKTFFATHYHELTRLEHPAVIQLCLDVLENEGNVVFLKRIKEGATTNSYGIHVARLAGIPLEVIERARNLLSIMQEKSITTNVSEIVTSVRAENTEQNAIPNDTEIKQELQKQTMNLPSLFSEEELVLDEILSANPDDITPMQALQKIIRWQEKLNGK